MWYFLVVTYKHLVPHRQLSLTQGIQDLKHTSSTFLLVQENGKNGDSPHYNLVIQVQSDVQARSFRQRIKRMYEENEYNDHTLVGRMILTEIQLANVVCGYLEKESTAKIISQEGIKIDALRKKHQPKAISCEEKYRTTTTAHLFNLCVNYYKQHCTTPFTKRLFKDIIKYISNSHNITSNIRNLKDIYLSLDGLLADGTALENYMDDTLIY